MHPVAKRRALRTIAVFEAIKGIAALAASMGLLSLAHHDVRHLAAELIGHFGQKFGARLSAILLHDADLLHDANLRSLLLLAIGYISLRLIEAYGLWHDLEWGEWIAALSGALYIPFEIRHLMYRPSFMGAVVLVGNVFVVGFLAWQLWRKRRRVA
jgi:uncharacterized membrane protein (DUF2068 family)